MEGLSFAGLVPKKPGGRFHQPIGDLIQDQPGDISTFMAG